MRTEIYLAMTRIQLLIRLIHASGSKGAVPIVKAMKLSPFLGEEI